MAGWGEKFNKMTQTAISKSKEVTEVTRLNMEINSLNQSIKEIATKIGEYVLKYDLLREEEAVAELIEQVETIKANIEANRQKILEVKNIQICPGCGAEVSRSSKFCDKCGTELMKVEAEKVEEVVQKTCTNCGASLEDDAMFCGECGTKQVETQEIVEETVEEAEVAE